MGRTKKEVHDGKQTLKQAKAAFKARGSTLVTDTEKRQLERGAILLQRAERIKEAETRKKEVLKKKTLQDTKATKACLLGTQRVNDKFGYQRSQFHLGAFLKPKAAVPAAPLPDVQEEDPPEEPWEDDGVDDDTLLDLAGESPVTTTKAQPAHTQAPAPSQQTPSKTHGHAKNQLGSPSTTDEFGSFDDLFDRSSQINLSTPQKPANAPSTTRSFDRIPSFTSGDFDLSADDLEELDWSVDNLPNNNISSPQALRHLNKNGGDMRNWLDGKEMGHDLDRKLMPPPPAIPKKCIPARVDSAAQTSVPPHGISFAELEHLAAEEIQLSQFGDW